MTYYPVFLNIRDRRCVVCGGGVVALRKVQGLLEHGAGVEVVSPSFCEELLALAETADIELHRREYREGDLDGAFVVIAATDDSGTNLRVADEARRRGCLVNVVDDAANSDFIMPSSLRRGDITIAVSTSGRSPALARKLRARLEAELGSEYAELVRLVGEVREDVKKEGVKVSEDIWQEALDLELLLALIKDGKIQEAKAAITRNLLKEVK